MAGKTASGREDVLRDYMGRASAGSFATYLGTRARTALRYVLEQSAQYAVGWVPGPVGMAARQFVYRPLLGRGSRAPVAESGVEIFHMDSLVLGQSVYIDRLCRIHASRAEIILGECTRVMRGAYLCSYVSNARPGEGIVTGASCWIGVNAVLASGQGGLTLGREVLVGPGAVLVTGDHDFADPSVSAADRAYTGRPIRVGDNVWIGAGAVVLGGADIGQGSVVAAGAVVTGRVDPYTVVGGVPAKVLKNIGEKS
ncbi:DapH/DapD/GlmU-related protein [Fundidesulfovibrio butyratiphilus]